MVKLILVLLVTPPETTFTPPVIAVAGTMATIWESLQLTIEATGGVPALNTTVLLPWVAPKPLPLICTWVPVGPLDGEMEPITGLGMENSTLVLLTPAAPVMVTGPLVALTGTVATICVSLQLTTEAVCPLKEM